MTEHTKGWKRRESVIDDGRRQDEGITSREAGEQVIKRRRVSLTSPGDMSDIDDIDDGVGLRWVVEYICYGYF